MPRTRSLKEAELTPALRARRAAAFNAARRVHPCYTFCVTWTCAILALCFFDSRGAFFRPGNHVYDDARAHSIVVANEAPTPVGLTAEDPVRALLERVFGQASSSRFTVKYSRREDSAAFFTLSEAGQGTVRFQANVGSCADDMCRTWDDGGGAGLGMTAEVHESELDWMALHGINLPLIITGREYVMLQLFLEFGMAEADILAFFT
eukprot:gene21794-26217_t